METMRAMDLDDETGWDDPTDDSRGLAGRLLIATPVIGDSRFERAVILMCAHSPEHAMGIIVNRPIEALRLPELLDQLGVTKEENAPDRQVLNGGPVDVDRGFVVHTDDYACEEATLPVSEGLALTATRDVLEAMASPSGPREAVLALGYAGWGPGQLESEIQANAWLIAEADNEIVFSEDADEKWAAALARIGVTPAKLSSLSGQA